MATDLEIRITAELSNIKAALTSLKEQIASVNANANKGGEAGNKIGAGMNKAAAGARSAAKETKTLADQANRAKSGIMSMVAGIGALVVVKGLARMADEAANLRGQLALATKNTKELVIAQAETFAIAQRTRQDLSGTVQLYAKIQRSGIAGQRASLELTEQINNAIALSFTGAEAGKAALIQLGQAMASGTLRGDELNSVMEQTPRLAKAIADGLVEIGKIKDPGDLRNYAQKNGIAVQDLVKALETQKKVIESEAKTLPLTIEKSFTVLHNAMLRFVGDADAASGTSKQIAGYIEAIAHHVSTLAGLLILGAKAWLAYYAAFRFLPGAIALFAGAETAAGAAGSAAAGGVGRFAAATTAAGTAAEVATAKTNAFSLSMNVASLRGASMATKLRAAGAVVAAAFVGWEIGTYLKNEFQVVEQAGIALAGGMTKIAVRIKYGFLIAWTAISEGAKTAFNAVLDTVISFDRKMAETLEKLPGVGDALATAYSKAANSLDHAKAKTRGVGTEVALMVAQMYTDLDKVDGSFAALFAAADRTNKKLKDTTDKPDPAGDGGKTGKGVQALIDKYALLKDSAERALTALERLYNDAGISISAYYAKRVELQRAAIQADIAAAQQELAVARAAAAKKGATEDTAAEAKKEGDIITKITLLRRRMGDVGVQAAHDQADAEKELADKLNEIQADLLDASGDTTRATTMRLEAQYRDLIRRLKAEANTAGVELVERLINVKAAKAGLDQLKGQFDEYTSALSQLQATTSAQVSAGLLSNATAEKRIQEARAQTLDQLKSLRERTAALYAEYKNPEALLQLQRLDEQIAQLSISTDDWRGKIQDIATDSLTQFFKDLADGSTSASEAIMNLARNFVQAMAAMAAQALAKKAIQSVMDLFTQGGDGKGNAGSQVASAAAAGLAYATPVSTAAIAMSAAGGTLLAGGAAVSAAAVALQAAATTLLVANAASSAAMAHSGGVIGAGVGSRVHGLPAAMFRSAPRYHTGGIAGLAPDEVPTVLKRGEEVLTRNNPRHRYNAGSDKDQAQAGIRMVLVDDSRRVGDFIQSAEGERVIVRIMQRNRLSTRS
jgi:tape measure domain-containing protein